MLDSAWAEMQLARDLGIREATSDVASNLALTLGKGLERLGIRVRLLDADQ